MQPRAPQSVERFFEFSLLGLVLSGFLAVVGSGRLDLPTAVLTSLGLVLRALLVSGLLKIELPAKLVNAAALAYIGFYPIDYTYLSRDFITATVHMVFFVATLRILSARSDRDYFFVKAVAFLELLSASLLSSGLNFFFFLALFLIFGVATFASSEIRRSAKQPNHVVRGGMQRFHWRLAGLAFCATIGILIMTAGLFFLLPRTARAAFRHLVSERYHLPGFSNEVRLGQLGEIKQSSTPVMHIRIEKQTGPMALKWRGGALSSFDGQRWYNPPNMGEPLRVTNHMVQLAASKQSWREGRRITYEIRIESLDSDALFFTGIPEFARIDMPSILRTPVDTYRTGLGTSDGLHYYGVSQLDPTSVASTYQADPLPPLVQQMYTRLPAVDPRIRELALEVTGGKANDEQKSRAIERYLTRNYSYTMQLLDRPVHDPLADFLFKRKAGHCEYFASAMAVMLRTIGIPSRMVTGFQSGVYNSMTDWYVLRASDAHSWVEAYVPNRGWITFDPTPPDLRGGGTSLFSNVALYMDAAETFWQEWVLNYNLDRQMNLALKVDQSSRASVNWFERWNMDAKATIAETMESAKRWAGWLVAAIAFCALLLFFGPAGLAWMRLHLHVRRVARGAVHSSDAAILYARMLAILKRRGYEKPLWLTPAEFARVLPTSPMADTVASATTAYNELRFGGRPEAGVRMLQLLRELETN